MDVKDLIKISIHAPLAGSDNFAATITAELANFNPRSPCGERRKGTAAAFQAAISIHAPLAGSDQSSVIFITVFRGFQSTLPLRGATPFTYMRSKMSSISIHAPLAGSD